MEKEIKDQILFMLCILLGTPLLFATVFAMLYGILPTLLMLGIDAIIFAPLFYWYGKAK